METLTLTFQLKKSKLNAGGKAPINLRVTINSKRIELSTRQYVEPIKWDNNKKCIKGRFVEKTGTVKKTSTILSTTYK